MSKISVFKTAMRLYFVFAVLFLAMAGCDLPDPFFVPVSFIEGVPETGMAGTPLALTGSVRPGFASNQGIVWLVADAGNTEASISGNILNANSGGIVTIKAIIANGTAEGKDYTQEFEIVFNTPKVITGIAVTTQPEKLAYTEGEILDLSGIVVTLTFEDTSTEDVGLARFTAKGITADPAHGTALTLAHNDQPVVVTAGGYNANTNNLTVVESINSAAINVTPPAKNGIPNTTATSSGHFTTGAVSWSPANNPFQSDTAYTATVTLTANEGYKFPDTFTATINGNNASISDNIGTKVTISYTFAKTSLRYITGITINTQPAKLDYTSGETLNLSGLVVTLTFDSGSPENVAYSNFNSYNITASPSHGTVLNLEHNGTHVVVTAPGGHSDNTNNLIVTKAAGSAVTTPIVSGTPTSNSITVNAVNLQTATGQSIEYAILNVNNGSPSTWQSGTTFTGLTSGTTYYVYARSKADTNYNAGTASVSAGITTAKAAGSAVSTPSGTWNLTATTITVTAVSLSAATGQEIEYAISTSGTAAPASLEWAVNKFTFTINTTDTTYYIYARSKENANYNAGDVKISAGIATSTGPFTSPKGIELVPISAGTFTMGSPTTEAGSGAPEYPQHSVTLTKSFYMGKYEVTQKQYQIVMDKTIQEQQQLAEGSTTDYGRGDNYPMYFVSWYDVLVFCNKLSMMEDLDPVYSISGSTDPAVWIAANGGSVPTSNDTTWNNVVMNTNKNGYRLPTEAEWEYACRAGTTTAFNNGNDNYNDTASVGAVAWYRANSENKTHEVGEKLANAWGLFDMHGNVFEWCWDWYGSYPIVAQTDPAGASSVTYRVSRGGSWYALAQDQRSAYRVTHDPNYQDCVHGFRLVRTIQ